MGKRGAPGTHGNEERETRSLQDQHRPISGITPAGTTLERLVEVVVTVVYQNVQKGGTKDPNYLP